MPKRKTVGLAMSGGAARGIAQIGVLKALEEKKVPIDAIAGTSIGAIVGGLYSAGYSALEIEHISQNLNWEILTSLNNSAARQQLFLEQKWVRDRATVSLRFDGLNLMIPKSLSSAQDLTTSLDILCLNAPYHPISSFESLSINYRSIATDLLTGERVILGQGSLSEAMRASSTVPLLFMPIVIDHKELVDGGLVSNVPVDVLDSLQVDFKIAVNTMGTLYLSSQDLDLPWKTADQVISILMQEQNNWQLNQADAVIKPDIGAHESSNFSNLDSLLELGYQKGLALADSLNHIIFSYQPDSTYLAKSLIVDFKSTRPLPDSIRFNFLQIISDEPNIKKALNSLLETDLITKCYAEIDSSANTLTYVVEPLPRISDVKFIGETYHLRPKLQTCFEPILNQRYTNKTATLALENAMKVFRKADYPLIHFESIHIEQDTLELKLSSGKLDAIHIERSRKSTLPKVIERELHFDTSRALNPGRVKRSMQALYNMNIFDRINMWPRYQRDSTNAIKSNMVVGINERFSEILRFGFRFDNTYNSQFMLDFRNENFLGRAYEFGGWTTVGSHLFTSQVEFRIHRIWETYLTFFSKLFYINRNINIYNSQFTTPGNSPQKNIIGDYGQQFYGFSSAIGGQVSKDGQATIEFLLQNAEVSPGEFQIARESHTFKTLRGRFVVDNRDEPFEATTGTVLDIFYDFTPEFLNNDFSFSRISFSFKENISITSFFRYRINLNLGVADNRTPLSHQFSLGGVEQSYSIPFYGFETDELRGRQVVRFGVDFIFDSPFQFVFPTYFSLHYNMGNMWNELSSIKFEHLYHGLGLELSLKTPIGPARLVLSKPFIFDDSDLLLGSSVFNFVLGYEF